ncbi:hypothetical protein F2P56_023085 [Juglans regia]|uniref:Uncharacterized protein n=1 Tax=Juglans regia TaxID=51240 RepID=A0A833X500_JUGRE|nr:hypothetical protein F2P56_023085 [Juglans regia]
MKGTISGVPLARGKVKMNHVFFADDSLLFCQANMKEWMGLNQILNGYEEASGQKLNRQKTTLFFSKNTKQPARNYIKQVTGLADSSNLEKYLGLPSLIGRSKVREFQGILERVSKRIGNWKTKFLSQAGKEILLKAIIQTITTYSMSVFLLPKLLCNKLNSMMSNFWWASQDKVLRCIGKIGRI